MIIIILLLGLVTYFIYEMVIKLYYKYYWYVSQDIPVLKFPLPVIGNILELKKAVNEIGPYSKTQMEIYWHNGFGEKLPPVFAEFRVPQGSVIINDPYIVNELYTTKNRVLDKHQK